MKTAVMLLAALAAGVYAAETAVIDLVVVPKEDGAGVYSNEIRGVFEQPLFKASREDRLLVIATRGDCFLVKDRDDRQGWIAKSACTRLPRGTKFLYDPIGVKSFEIDDIFVYVPVPDRQNDDRILLDRSFADELTVNSDQEAIERMAGK